jgi:hypothetical protein
MMPLLFIKHYVPVRQYIQVHGYVYNHGDHFSKLEILKATTALSITMLCKLLTGTAEC